MSVYLYKPPARTETHRVAGSRGISHVVYTTVYRSAGTWVNAAVVADPPDIDVDSRTGLLLHFTKPRVVPGTLHDELAALTPADSSWTDGELVLL